MNPIPRTKTKLIKRLLISLCSLFLLCLFLYTQCYRKVSDPQYLQISHVTVTQEEITVLGSNGSAGMFNYRGFETAYQDYGGWRLPWMEETNSPAFYPVPNVYPALQEIRLQSSDKTNSRLIWTAQDGEITDSTKQR